MKIVFLCGSLEPGLDGVGDYTRRLSAELIKQGHQIAIVSLNDAFIKEENSSNQVLEGVSLSVLRLPYSSSHNIRFKRAKEFIDIFNPDWVSLQFVPFSFHQKGLLFSQIKHFKFLTKGRFLHIMLHEAWVGKGTGFNYKKIAYSLLQEATIKKLFKSLHPKLIHTHIPSFFHKFKRMGWVVGKLPLFSNIPLFTNDTNAIDRNKIKIGFFSQMEMSDSILKFIKTLEENLNDKALHLEILLFGGSQATANTCKQILEEESTLRNKIILKGHLCDKELSLTLQECNLGMTPVPRHALGKSGSVAAFISHGVPVAAPNIHHGFLPGEIGFFDPAICLSIITEPDKNSIHAAAKAALAARSKIDLTTIAKTFISDLIVVK